MALPPINQEEFLKRLGQVAATKTASATPYPEPPPLCVPAACRAAICSNNWSTVAGGTTGGGVTVDVPPPLRLPPAVISC